MPRAWTCTYCGTENASGNECDRCGKDRKDRKGRGAGRAAPSLPAACPADGTTLQADGWCDRGGGYIAQRVCPFVCPHCRKPLSWSGACEHCHGCTTGRREGWTFPGDRYELEAGHWVKVAAGPRPVCTPDQNRAGAELIRHMMAQGVTAADAVDVFAGTVMAKP